MLINEFEDTKAPPKPPLGSISRRQRSRKDGISLKANQRWPAGAAASPRQRHQPVINPAAKSAHLPPDSDNPPPVHQRPDIPDGSATSVLRNNRRWCNLIIYDLIYTTGSIDLN